MHANWGATAVALALAHGRYWTTVAPHVRAELRRWRELAQTIQDPVLRAHALGKLEAESANTEGTATLCTLAPRARRRSAVDACVALQVMYDYLDAVTEDPVRDPLRDGRQMFEAFKVALTPGADPVDYYRHHPHKADNGYLEALVAHARRSLARLPAAAAVLPVARETAARFGEAQTRSHAVPSQGATQLEQWAEGPAAAMDLRWWEWAGGAAASVLGIHALVSAAADARTTRGQALAIDRAYLLHSTLATMLDSVVDDEDDAAAGEHRYVAYYSSADETARRIAAIARSSIAASQALPHAAHHSMTVSGLAGFYLSAPSARTGAARTVAARVTDELKPLVLPVLVSLRLWRRLKRPSAP
jgi:tetraprenyl-beta-curcumene synthase